MSAAKTSESTDEDIWFGDSGSPAVFDHGELEGEAEQEASVQLESDIMAHPVMPSLVVKLTDANYAVCSCQMKHFLARESFWTCTDAPPQVPTAEEKVRDQKALSTIILSVGDVQLVHIVQKVSPKAA